MTEYNDDVIDQLGEVRETGKCNMLNRACVQNTAHELGFDELYDFMKEANNEEYTNYLREMGSRR